MGLQLIMQSLKFKERLSIGKIENLDNSIDNIELPLIDKLFHFIAGAVPLHESKITILILRLMLLSLILSSL